MSTIAGTPIATSTTLPTRSKRAALDDEIAKICLDWWADLNAVDPASGKDNPAARPARGAIAQLRRIGTVEAPAGGEIDTGYAASLIDHRGKRVYGLLRERLKGKLSNWHDDYVRRIPLRPDFDAAVAVVAATLARVRENEKRPVAKRLGGKTRDEAPLMAEVRFKRLIRTTDAPDLLDQGRRIVMLLGRTVSVGDLGASLLLWTIDPYAKRRWSFAYYDADMSAETDAEPDDAASATPTTST